MAAQLVGIVIMLGALVGLVAAAMAIDMALQPPLDDAEERE